MATPTSSASSITKEDAEVIIAHSVRLAEQQSKWRKLALAYLDVLAFADDINPAVVAALKAQHELAIARHDEIYYEIQDGTGQVSAAYRVLKEHG